MSSNNIPTTGPTPEQFLGPSTARLIKRVFHATRPKFFPASILPVLAGSAWGFMAAGHFDAISFSLALLATVCVHAGANVLNDVGDDAGGTDRQNEDRVYPYTGGSRFIQTGIMSVTSMARLGISLLTVAAIAGLLLLLIKGSTVLWFGIAGILLATLYSLGPLRLSALGLGEIAVGVAFGLLPVVGSAWLQSGVIDLNAVVFALPISAWVTAILMINEVPDIVPDALTGKRTLVVRLGKHRTAVAYALTHLFAASAAVWLAVMTPLPAAAAAVPILLLLLAFKASGAIRHGIENRADLTKAIESTLGIHTIGTLWLTACALFVAFWPA